MQYLLGCLGLIIVIAIIIAIVQWLFSNIIGIFGLAIAAWAGYQWYQNRKLGAKSKVPAIILAFGLLIAFSGFSSAPDDEVVQDKQDVKLEEEPSKLDDKESKPSDVKETTVPVNTSDTSEANKKIPVELVEVIDGNTIRILYDGQEQNVRYLLIDTPATNHPQLGGSLLEKKQKNATKSWWKAVNWRSSLMSANKLIKMITYLLIFM